MKTTLEKLKSVILPLLLMVVSLSWAQSEAIYHITVTTTWNETEHTSVPTSAHWSTLIGATHSTADEFMSVGSLATQGIKDIAESGSNGVFRGYIMDAITIDGDADQLLEDTDGFQPYGAIGSSGFMNVTVSEDFPLVTFVSMVAPSPDWFIAVNSESLRSGNPAVNNGWKDDYTLDVFAYDSGTDDGVDYTSGNDVSSPFVPISMILGPPINGYKMATISFDYQSSTLGIDDVDPIDKVKVYPNPVVDILTITKASDVVSTELINVLGKRVKVLTETSSNDIRMDVSDLQPGIYILRLLDIQGDSSTRKIIIE